MQKVRRATQGIQGQLRTFARVAAASFAVVGGAQTARNVLRVADSLEQFSRRIGVNAQQLQAWQQVATQFNVQTNALNIGLQRLQRRAAEAAVGQGEARGALRELGIDAERFIRLNLDDQILDLAQAFEGVSENADKTRLAFKLFDSEGVQFLQFLSEGEEGLAKLRGETTAWSDETRKALADANTELAVLGDQFTILAGKTVAFVKGAGQSFLDWLKSAQFSGRGGRSGRNRNTGRSAPGIDPVLEILGGSNRPTSLGGGSGAAPAAGGAATGSIFSGPLAAIGQAEKAIAEARRQSVAAGMNAVMEYNRLRIQEEKRVLQEQARLQEAAAEDFGNLFVANLVQAADAGFDSILNSWVRLLQQMVLRQAASGLFTAFGNTAFGGGLLGLLGFQGFGGGRATGGSVMAGKAYLVGERGPELFMPPGSGSVKPMGGTTNITVNAPNATPGMEQKIAQAVQVAVKQAEANVYDRVRRR